MCTNIPADQTSTGLPYGLRCMTSGAMKWGVPILPPLTDCELWSALEGSWMETPKPPSLTGAEFSLLEDTEHALWFLCRRTSSWLFPVHFLLFVTKDALALVSQQSLEFKKLLQYFYCWESGFIAVFMDQMCTSTLKQVGEKKRQRGVKIRHYMRGDVIPPPRQRSINCS